MSDSHDGSPRARPQLIDMAPQVQQPSRNKNRNRRKKSGNHRTEVMMTSDVHLSYTESTPIEAQPVIEAVLNYGKKTYALGTVFGVTAMTNLIDKIRALEPSNKDLLQIITEAHAQVDLMKGNMTKAYEENFGDDNKE